MAINASICDRDLRQLSQVNTPRKVQKIIMPVKILLRHSPMPLKIMPQHGPRKVQKIIPVTPSLPPLPPPRPSASENFAPAWPQKSKENYAREVSAGFLPLRFHCFQLLHFRFRSSSHRCHCVHVAQLVSRATCDVRVRHSDYHRDGFSLLPRRCPDQQQKNNILIQMPGERAISFHAANCAAPVILRICHKPGWHSNTLHIREVVSHPPLPRQCKFQIPTDPYQIIATAERCTLCSGDLQ